MITFERTWDYRFIRQTITNPKIWPSVSDDFSPAREDYVPPQDEGIWYVAVRDGREPLGLFAFRLHSPILWEVHTCLLPCSWGGRAKLAAREAVPWIWNNTDCRRIFTNVPAYNRLARRLALEAGLQQFGVNEKSYLKHGRLHDQILLGISRP